MHFIFSWEQIVLGKLADPKSVDLGLNLDSDGLGVFDAFFASLSMIIVSEVCACLLFCIAN